MDNASLYSEAVTLNDTGPIGIKKMGDVFVAFTGDIQATGPTLTVAIEELAKKFCNSMSGSLH